MADTPPSRPSCKEPGMTLEDERAAEGSERPRHEQPAPYGTRPGICWYRDPKHQLNVSWCPPTCNGPVTHSERAGDGGKRLYCEAHAYWRIKTIRLGLVRRLRPGEPLDSPTAPTDDARDHVSLEASAA